MYTAIKGSCELVVYCNVTDIVQFYGSLCSQTARYHKSNFNGLRIYCIASEELYLKEENTLYFIRAYSFHSAFATFSSVSIPLLPNWPFRRL